MRLFRFVVVTTLAIVAFLFAAPSTFDPAVAPPEVSAIAADTSAGALPGPTPLDD